MKTVLLFILLLQQQAFAQSLRYMLAQPGIHLSAYSSRQSDPFSFTANQAALASSKQAGIGIYGERRFMMKETSVYMLAASLPTRLGNFGVELDHAGFADFSENRIGLAYARRLGKFADVGVQFNYYGYRLAGYGNASTINFGIGTIWHLSDKINAGIHVYNPVGGKLGKTADAEKIAAVYKAGLGYDASDRFYVGTEIIKEEDKPVNVIAGMRYRFAGQFFAKAGFITATSGGYAGAGIYWKQLRLDLSFSYHPQLGITPGMLLIMLFKKSAE